MARIFEREMARWKQTRDEAYRFAVQAFFERTDFLRTLQHWILFYVKDSETKKSVLRQHQRRAIDAIIRRCAEGDRKRVSYDEHGEPVPSWLDDLGEERAHVVDLRRAGLGPGHSGKNGLPTGPRADRAGAK